MGVARSAAVTDAPVYEYTSPADGGDLLEFWLALFIFDSSASRRANKLRMSVSFSSFLEDGKVRSMYFFTKPAS